MNYKTIGDTLTIQEFNAIVYLFLKNVSLKEDIQIKSTDSDSSVIHGEYADYVFEIEYGNIVEDGILLSENTLQNGTNWLGIDNISRPRATYTLYYKIMHTSYNLIGGETTEITEHSIEFTNSGTSEFDFTDCEPNDILLFDVKVEIKYDKPIIEDVS